MTEQISLSRVVQSLNFKPRGYHRHILVNIPANIVRQPSTFIENLLPKMGYNCYLKLLVDRKLSIEADDDLPLVRQRKILSGRKFSNLNWITDSGTKEHPKNFPTTEERHMGVREEINIEQFLISALDSNDWSFSKRVLLFKEANEYVRLSVAKLTKFESQDLAELSRTLESVCHLFVAGMQSGQK